MKRFILSKIMYISIHKFWRGIYIHFLPKHVYRIYFDSAWNIKYDYYEKSTNNFHP